MYEKFFSLLDVFKKMGDPVPTNRNPRVLFAGEATSKKLWSFLHGARQTGMNEAFRIINLGKTSPKK